MMTPLPLAVRARLQRFEFEAAFQGLHWQPSSLLPWPGGRWLGQRGQRGAVEITVDTFPTLDQRQQLYRELQALIPEPLVLLVDRRRRRCLWLDARGSGVLVRDQPLWHWPPVATSPSATSVAPHVEALTQSLESLCGALGALPYPQRQPYAALILARLVAVAMVQRRGWLGDEWYLQNLYGQSQQRGPNRFFSEVLQPLWFQGLTLPPKERPYGVQWRLGEVPYVSPGLFQRRAVDQQVLAIPDSAFEPVLSWLGDLAATADPVALLAQAAEGWVNRQGGLELVTPSVLVEEMCDRIFSPAVLAAANALLPVPQLTLEDALVQLTPDQAAALLQQLLQLTVVDPACGSGRYLVAFLERLLPLAAGLMQLSQMALASAPLTLRRHLIHQVVFGIDHSLAAAELARLQLWLWLLASIDSPAQLAHLPNPCLSVLPGNALVGLVTVDEERFDRASSDPDAEALQGNLLQPLVAENYRSVLRERQVRLEDYRSQTQLLAEVDGIPGYVQAEFLSDRIDALNQIAQTKLDRLLLEEFSSQLGIRHRCLSGGKRSQRLLVPSDVSRLQPFHWGFYFHARITQRGGIDLILCHPPAGAVRPTPEAAFAAYGDRFEQRGISPAAFCHNHAQLRTIHPELEALWQEHRGQVGCLNDVFRRSDAYRHATQPPPPQRQMQIYWERLFLERIVQLLRPGGRAALVLPGSLWHQANGEPLRQWLQQVAAVGTVVEVSNHGGALGNLPARATLSLVDLHKGGTTATLQRRLYSHEAAPTATTLALCLQGTVDLPVEVGHAARVV